MSHYTGDMPEGGEKTRRTVRFTGRVQGVGFRATVTDIARRFTIAGSVRNLPGGGVELIAEGTADEIERFIAEINRRMGEFIRDAHATDGAAQGVVGFHIKR